ncbi:methyltransferase-like protein 6, partial [Agrilus planipennis]
REFTELLDKDFALKNVIIMEVGCGVGNFIFPLIEEGLDVFFIACDISPRAIDILKKNKYFDEKKINAFQIDITTEDIFNRLELNSVDIATLIFVLSAIHPDKFELAVKNIYKLLKPGGLVLFRDYGLYDMAQIRFKSGHKIAENFYMRQDGTRSYYFSIEHASRIFTNQGFKLMTCTYVHRRTVNKKENIDVPRIFVQAKFSKPGPDT